jgi:hypothetical protein
MWKLLIVITLGQTESDNTKRMMRYLTDTTYLKSSYYAVSNVLISNEKSNYLGKLYNIQ